MEVYAINPYVDLTFIRQGRVNAIMSALPKVDIVNYNHPRREGTHNIIGKTVLKRMG
jgi:lactate dehydrogenase-like 2-hydroxyacid dehydrogenase